MSKIIPFTQEPIAKLHDSGKSMILSCSCQNRHAGSCGGGENILEQVEELPPRQGATKGRFYASKSFAIGSQGPHIRVTLQFENRTLQSAALSLAKSFECEIKGEPHQQLLSSLLSFLTAYSKKKSAEVALDLKNVPGFRQQVLRRLQQVPFGTVVSYGQLAELAGSPRAARAVGTACHFNPFPLFIPCHRVIASGGKIGGFASDLQIKQRLLDFESL